MITSKQKIIESVSISLFIIIAIILSALFTKLALYGIFLSTLLLYLLSIRLNLFKDIDIPIEVTRTNKTIPQSIKEISNLLNFAYRNTIIVSGSLNEEIWSDSNILRILSHLITNKVQITILCAQNLNITVDSPLYHFLKKNINENSIKFFYSEKRPESHFVLVDDTHVRLEVPHEPNAKEREAIIKIHRGSLAARARNKFIKCRIDAIIVNSGNFSDLKFNKK